ncbi:MAG TPA: S8 family serine peptidase [Nannocystaceae bacterium]|nr:S8 family serine peptidase [Nannocystaceae bacterium]
MSDSKQRQSRARVRVIGCIAIAGIAGCGAELDDVEAPVVSPRASVSSTSTVESACWAVGVITASCEPKDCPDAWICPEELEPGWDLQGKRMFVDGTNALAAVGLGEEELPLHLRRFCLYRANAPDLGLEEPKLPASIDCPVVMAHADPLAGLHERLARIFELQADADPATLVPGGHPVEVAIVDTHSDRSSGGPTVAHATAVRRVVDRLACPAGGCGVTTMHALALPLDLDGLPLDPDDGLYGTRAHLALGIVEAVSEFRKHAANAKDGRRLVVNLSVGWTAEMGGDCSLGEDEPWCGDHVGEMVGHLGTASNEPLPWRYAAESLHAALLYASCHGALIVTAAGNAKGDSCNVEPVAPGVWGSYRAPTEAECDALGFTPPPEIEARLPANEDVAWPLVLPVSAERPDGRPIAATRPGSITPLVAPGWHVSLDAGEMPLTGTSISAAAVSGAAALVWSQGPGMHAGEVLHKLYDLGTPSSATPASELALYHWPAGTEVRRLALCAAQPLGAGGCLPAIELESALENLAEVAEQVGTNATTVEQDALAIGLAPDNCEACNAKATAWIPATLDATDDAYFFDSCDTTPTSFAFDTRSELAGPQPTVPICPECPLVVTNGDGRARAFLTIDPSYRDGSVTLVGANLVLADKDGMRSMFALPMSTVLGELIAGETVAFELAGTWSELTYASINAVLVDGRTGDSFVRSNELMLVVR